VIAQRSQRFAEGFGDGYPEGRRTVVCGEVAELGRCGDSGVDYPRVRGLRTIQSITHARQPLTGRLF
jgi:hypothetical protein